MRRIFYISLAVLWLLPAFTFGDNGILEIDDSVKGNENIILELIDMSDRYNDLDEDLALLALEKGLDIDLSNVSDKTRFLYYYKIGKLYLVTSNHKKAIDFLKLALRLGEQVDSVEQENEVLLYLGVAYFHEGDITRSNVYLNSANTEAKNVSDSAIMLKSLYFLAKNELIAGNKDSAKNQFYSSMLLADTLKNHEYYLLNRFELHKLGTAVSNQSIEDELRNDINYASKYNYRSIPLAYSVISDYYDSMGKSDSASKYLIKKIDAENAIISSKVEGLTELFDAQSLKGKNKKNSSYTNEIILIIVSLLIIAAILIIFIRHRKYNIQFKSNIQKATDEIGSFNQLTEDFDKKVEEASNQRIKQLEEDIEAARQSLISFKNSKNKLIEVNNYKDKFMSKISHEIRTPLSTILGFAEILEDQLALKEQDELYTFARNISESGKNLILLLNNILDISKLNAQDIDISMKEYDVVELTNSVIEVYSPLAEVKGLRIIGDFDDCPPIISDKNLFNRILTNIIDNAVKFTESGYIKVSVSFNRKTKAHQLLIKDTGIGIDKAYLSNVFEPYRQESLGYSASMQGAGLGLPLAKKMTELLNGSINLESVKGTGTTIELSFQIESHGEIGDTKKVENKPDQTHDKQSKNKEDVVKDELPWERLSILVVEDDTTNQILFSKMLKRAEEVEIAKDGKTAFSILEKRSKDFDLVLMDINLPGDWNGIELQKEIRSKYEQYQSIPFIAQTAYAISGNREKMMSEGFDEYITKPISKASLIKAIKVLQIS